MKEPTIRDGLDAFRAALSTPRYYMTEHMMGQDRCPHCSVPNPDLQLLWKSSGLVRRGTLGLKHRWATYACSRCGGVVLAQGAASDEGDNPIVVKVVPAIKSAHEDIPEPAKAFLQQAFDTLHAPDAAAVMAGAAVDGMLKVLGYVDGSVYSRIDAAVKDHPLTKSMGEWAHEVRLGSNRPRHADSDRPHVSPDEASQSVEFAEALGHFLFVLSKRIIRGKEAAITASAPLKLL